MPSRARAALVVALLAVTAGCGGVTDGPTAEPTATTVSTVETTTRAPSTTVPETTSAPPTVDVRTITSGDLPPGVTEDGVADARALAEAHADLLRNQPYVAHVSVVNRFPNGTLALEKNRTVRYGDGEYVYDQRPTGPLQTGWFVRQTIWGNGTVELVRSKGPNGSVTYDRTDQPIEFGAPGYWEDTLYGLAGTGGFFIEGTLLSDPPKYRLASYGPTTADGAENTTISVLVDPRGFVEEYRYEYDRQLHGDVPVETVRTVEFSTVDDSTIQRPLWYEAAINATADDPAGP